MNILFFILEVFLTILPVLMPVLMYVMMARRGQTLTGLAVAAITIPMALFIGAAFYSVHEIPFWGEWLGFVSPLAEPAG